ncbi:MAG: hypothetical protein HY721_30615 [Planctomycetes bacterium]|nr:hypothetical protein [Planctomycetota bacterium]
MNAAKRHRRAGSRLVSAISVIVLACVAAPWRAAAAEDVTRDWELKLDMGGRETFGSLSISKKADGSLAGKWGSTELSDVKLDGQKLSFVRTLRFGDQEFRMTYEGTLKDGVLSGTISSERGSFSANGTRRKPISPALGRWDLKYAIGDREISATLAVSAGPGGALEAKWTTETGEHVVSDVKLEGGKLSLARKSKIGEREFESTYEGKVDGNKLTGIIKGQLGEIPASGQRVGGDLVGTWELTTTTERGTRTSTLVVQGDLTARYELFGGEIPIKDIKLEGGQVTFSAEAGFGDQSFKLEFKGKLEGTTLKGTFTTPRGTREATGKKVSPTTI